jgi:hypothetical protein
VPAGLLDDLETLEIGAHLYAGSKASLGNDSIQCPAFRNDAEAVTIDGIIEFSKAMTASIVAAQI